MNELNPRPVEPFSAERSHTRRPGSVDEFA